MPFIPTCLFLTGWPFTNLPAAAIIFATLETYFQVAEVIW